MKKPIDIYKGHIKKIVFQKKKSNDVSILTKLKMFRLAIYYRINDANREIPAKWIREYNDLIRMIKDKKYLKDQK